VGKGSVWLWSDRHGHQFEILLPTNRDLGDYAIRIGEALHTLAVVEDREPQDVYAAFANGAALPVAN
jgi:hypothetical protein